MPTASRLASQLPAGHVGTAPTAAAPLSGPGSDPWLTLVSSSFWKGGGGVGRGSHMSSHLKPSRETKNQGPCSQQPDGQKAQVPTRVLSQPTRRPASPSRTSAHMDTVLQRLGPRLPLVSFPPPMGSRDRGWEVRTRPRVSRTQGPGGEGSALTQRPGAWGSILALQP